MKAIKSKFTPFIAIAIIFLAVSLIGFKPNVEQSLTKDIVNHRAVENLKQVNMTVSEEIAHKKAMYNFKNVPLFRLAEQSDSRALNEFVTQANFLTLNEQTLNNLFNEANENIQIVLPVDQNNNLTMYLTKHELVTPEFRFAAMETMEDIPFQSLGIHYKGVIEGIESVVAISIFPNHVVGIISDESGNWNLGSIKDDQGNYSNNYIYYNDKYMIVRPDLKCYLEGRYGTANQKLNEFDMQLEAMKEKYQNEIQSDNPVVTPMKVYFVADYSFWQASGGNGQVIIDFIVGFFNSVKTLYQNENIPFQIAFIAGYTSPDPMLITSDTYYALKIFAAQIQNNMQGGHIAHLLSLRQEYGGGIASGIGTLCQQYNPADSSGSYCLSGVAPEYQNFPNYSWTVLIVTHEMGHNMGSRHTHACHWPQPGGGPVGPIDTCIITGENSSFAGPWGCIPANPQWQCAIPAPGTIMSYCHFCQTNNFLLGFGPYPGDTIRLRYAQAQPCLTVGIQNVSTEIPEAFSLKQNYPNPFNPVTNIKFDVAVMSDVKLYVYDITGKVVSVLVNETLSPGSYLYTFDAATLPSGVYFYRLEAGGLNQVKKMLLIK